MSLVIKGGRIITASDDYVADVFIEDETVSSIGQDLRVTADHVIDATGKYVMPGGVDPHTPHGPSRRSQPQQTSP